MTKIILVLIASVTLAMGQTHPLKIFISVDMEGIAGIGTAQMVSNTGKDYATGRKLMTDEVNAVVSAIFQAGPAQIVVNDSHGDMQNLLHIELDPRVEYIQSNIKPLGMVQGLDASYSGIIFIGYHSMAGTENGFLAHTGSGTVKGLWINDVEVGEGGLNAYYAGSIGVPVILASGDRSFAAEIKQLVNTRIVITKEAIGSSAARLLHPDVVKKELQTQTAAALKDLRNFRPLVISQPITFKMKLESTTRADVAMSIPHMKRIDGYTISYTAKDMDEAYRLIRVVYKYLSW